MENLAEVSIAEKGTQHFQEMNVLTGISIAAFFLVIVLATFKADALVFSIIATTSSEAESTLQEAGFSSIEVKDSTFSCGWMDFLGRDFRATDPNGIIVSGNVCCSWIPVVGNDCTVRFDKTTSEKPEVVFLFLTHSIDIFGKSCII